GQALLRGQRLENGPQVVQEGAQAEPLGVQLHLPCLHPGQVEDVVDELQQVGSGGVDDVRVLDLLGRQVLVRVVGKQPGQDEQAVQRGAQFVRHVGKELRLVPGRQVELAGAFLQFLPRLLDLHV